VADGARRLKLAAGPLRPADFALASCDSVAAASARTPTRIADSSTWNSGEWFTGPSLSPIGEALSIQNTTGTPVEPNAPKSSDPMEAGIWLTFEAPPAAAPKAPTSENVACGSFTSTS
jgi:hypothetical protein